jgi:hypothetical protein
MKQNPTPTSQNESGQEGLVSVHPELPVVLATLQLQLANTYKTQMEQELSRALRAALILAKRYNRNDPAPVTIQMVVEYVARRLHNQESS